MHPIFRQPTWDKRDSQPGDRYNQRSMELSAFLFWTLVNICARSKSWIIVGVHTKKWRMVINMHASVHVHRDLNAYHVWIPIVRDGWSGPKKNLFCLEKWWMRPTNDLDGESSPNIFKHGQTSKLEVYLVFHRWYVFLIIIGIQALPEKVKNITYDPKWYPNNFVRRYLVP